MKRKILAAALSLVMALGLTAIPSGQAATAKAAGNKGAVVVSSFPETTWDTAWDNEAESRITFNLWGPDNVTLSENVTLSYNLYVSKGLFDAEDDAINIYSEVGVMQGEEHEWVGALYGVGGMDFIYNGENDGGFSFSQWDEVQEKDVPVSCVSMEEKGDYYVFSVKDYPVGAILDYESMTKLDSTKPYNIEFNLDVRGVNSVSGDVVVILDDVKVMDGDTELFSQDFESKEECGGAYKPGVEMGKWPKISGTSYDTSLLSLKKNKAEIKVGKKVKIKASAVAGATVTYKSNKPKVATVDKNGKVVGVKKGTAVISVTSCGKTLKYKVKVKK